MATKQQLIEFILEFFMEADGSIPSKSKLDGYKKGDLAEFIKDKGATDDLIAWLDRQ